MPRHIDIKALYNHLYYWVWRALFSSRFKNFGESKLVSPLKIFGAEYIEIGNGVLIADKAWLTAEKQLDCNPNLVIGDFTSIGHYATISCVKDVSIGRNVLIADRVYISDNMHEYENIRRPIKEQPVAFKSSTVIGDDSWIGVNVAIIGAKIGRHCVIGANSVVTRDIPDYSVAAGSPAKIIKQYDWATNQWKRIDQPAYSVR